MLFLAVGESLTVQTMRNSWLNPFWKRYILRSLNLIKYLFVYTGHYPAECEQESEHRIYNERMLTDNVCRTNAASNQCLLVRN